MLAPSAVRAQSRRASLQTGVDLIQKGRESEALSVFRKLTETDPRFMEAWNNRAALEAAKGDLEAAQISLEKALAAHPDISVVTRNLEKVRSRLAHLAYDSAFGTPSVLPPLVLDLQREPIRIAQDTATLRQRDSLAHELALVRSASRQDLTHLDSIVSGRDAEIRRLRADLERANTALAMAQQQPAVVASAQPVAAPAPVAPVATRKPTPVVVAEKPAARTPATEPVAPTEPVRVAAAETKPAPAPVAKPEPISVKPKAKPPAKAPETSAAVLAALQGWAQAWSAQDVDQYLSYYSTRFVPLGQPDRAAWEASRRARITAPKSIRVEINSPKIRMLKGHHAEVVYRQIYQTEENRLTSRKRLELAWEQGVWRIFAEKEAR